MFSGAQDLRNPTVDQLGQLRLLPRVQGDIRHARPFVGRTWGELASRRQTDQRSVLAPLPRVALPAETRLTDELLNLHRGQGLDLFWRDSLQCPTEEEYVDMVNGSASFR